MTHAERFLMATQARQRKARFRAGLVHAYVASGMLVKQAAFAAGVSERTAKRYRAGAR